MRLNARSSRPAGRSSRSHVVSPNWVSCGARRYGTRANVPGAASVKHHRRKPFAPAASAEYIVTRSKRAMRSGLYCADDAPSSWIIVGLPAPDESATWNAPQYVPRSESIGSGKRSSV